MNCRKVNHLLSAYIDGELNGVEQLQVRQHLRDCPCCTEEHESLLSTKRLLSGLCVKHPSLELEKRILSRLNDADDGGADAYGLRVRWAMLPDQYRRWSRMGAFCVTCSVALALMMVAVTPSEDEMRGVSLASGTSTLGHNDSQMPVRDAIFIHNPMDNVRPVMLQQLDVEQPFADVRR